MWQKATRWIVGLTLGLLLVMGTLANAGQPSVARAEEFTPTPTPTAVYPDGNPGGSGGE